MFIILESSETYAYPTEFEGNRRKTKFRRNFLSKKSQKPKIKIVLNEKMENNRIFFLHTFQNITPLLGPKTQFGQFSDVGGGGSSLGNTRKLVTSF